MKKFITLLTIIVFTINVNAQKNEPAKATYISKSTSMRIAPSLASRSELIIAKKLTAEPKDGRSSKNKAIIGKDPQTENDFFASNPHPLAQKISTRSVNFTFEVDNSVGPPSDPALAVGPNHVMMVYNTGFSIYDKSGTEIQGPLAVTNIFSAGGCCDLTISYDNAADRWVMTYLYVGNGIEVAVSDGPNPETANWFVYSIPQVNDYNKLSVWSDGYYITDNTSAANKIYVLERDEMLAGNPSAQIIGFPLPGIVTSGFFSPQALNVTNSNLPATGGATFVYLQDDAWAGVAQDHLKIWTLDVDWVTPGSSTISAAQTINTTPFIAVFDGGSFSNLAQPGGGTSIDALQATIMNQAQFRKFAGHNSAVFNFVVDTDATAGELAGVRWFELRQSGDNQPWYLFQEGTYTAPDGRHAWHASMAMDNEGNIAMGYTSMSGPTTPTTVRVSSYYTGRFVNDPLGTMNISEELIANGTGNVGGTRYGDYSKIDVDPSDDSTFWFINEYINGGGKNIVGVFNLELLSNDTGVTNIDAPTDGSTSATEQVTITINNFGDSPQSNIPVSYTFNGNTENEVYTGTIAAASSAQYTFTATVDMSTGEVYNIEACTNLSGDENTSNNCSNVILNQLTLCTPIANDGNTSTDTGCNLDGIKHFILGTIDIDDGANGCNNEGGSGIKGYADRRHLSTDLDLQVGTYTLQAQMNWDGGVPTAEQLSVWIDFNDNGTFEGSEQLISGATFTADNALVNFDLILPASSNLGSHILRARCLDTTGSPGDVNDPCANYQFGETHDYTVNIVDSSIGVDDELFNETDFIVSTLNNNQFNISVNTTEITDRLTFTVTNLVGQKLLSYQLENTNGKYEYDLDMSYATPGVYIIRLGNTKLGNTKKIIIK